MAPWKELLFLGSFFVHSGYAQCDDVSCNNNCVQDPANFGACKCVDTIEGRACATCPPAMGFFGDTIECVNNEAICTNQLEVDNCQLPCDDGYAGDCKCIEIGINGPSECILCPPGHIFSPDAPTMCVPEGNPCDRWNATQHASCQELCDGTDMVCECFHGNSGAECSMCNAGEYPYDSSGHCVGYNETLFFAKKLQSQLGIDNCRANNVEIINQSITGNVIGNVIDAKEKAKYIDELCDQYKLKNDQVIAIGDGANDIEMMKVAGLSVAYHAKPILKQYCDIQINYGSLASLIDFFEYA